MGRTTRGWAIALVVIGLLAIATGLAAGQDASVAAGVVALGMGLWAFFRLRAGRDPGF